MTGRFRTIRTTVLGGMAVALAGCGMLVALASSAPSSDMPDLTPLLPTGQSNVNDRWVDTQVVAGRTLYRFDTVIKNSGSGAFEVYRSPSGATFQRIWSGGDPIGTGTAKSFPAAAPPFEDVAVAAGGAGQPNALAYSPAYGHEHFHSQRIAAYSLLSPAGAPLKESSKNLAGFCLYDSYGPPASGEPIRYPAQYGNGTRPCASGEPNYTGLLRMGIQRGWGDFYGSQLTDQWVDVTDVAPGAYRLRANVDPDGLYRESNEANNAIEVPVVIPGVAVAPRTAATAAGAAVTVPLSATVVGADVKSRLPGCAENQTGLASCTTTATPGAVSLSVTQPPASRGTVKLAGATATYTPPAGFSGTAVFTYRGTDSRGLTSAPATVTVSVGGAGFGGTTTGGRRKGRITLSARQLLISQRIGQAAIRRLNLVEALLDGKPAPAAAPRKKAVRIRVTIKQMRINQRIYQAAVRRANALEARLDGVPPPAATAGAPTGRLRLTVAQVAINQRIAEAALRRANALLARVR